MKSKTVEHNSNRLQIVITYQDEQFLAGLFAMSGVAILILTYLGITPKILASFMQRSDDLSDLSIFCYIAGLVALIHGIFGLYSSFLVSKFTFDKMANKLEIESKNFAKTNKQVYPLSEVTGIEELSKPKTTPELFLWIKKGNQTAREPSEMPVSVTPIGLAFPDSFVFAEIFDILTDKKPSHSHTYLSTFLSGYFVFESRCNP